VLCPHQIEARGLKKMAAPLTVARRPRLTARQVGMVAALGGLGFAWRALGLVIPLYPPFVLDVRETLIAIVAFAGGPYVAIASGFLMGIPSAIPMNDIWYYPLVGLILCAFTKIIWNNRGWKGYLLLVVVMVVAEFIGTTLSIAFLAYGLSLVPFWPEYIANFVSGTYFIYVAQEVIPAIICIKFFPDFMKPRWLWRGGEAVD
jgi:hypothetical protein